MVEEKFLAAHQCPHEVLIRLPDGDGLLRGVRFLCCFFRDVLFAEIEFVGGGFAGIGGGVEVAEFVVVAAFVIGGEERGAARGRGEFVLDVL